MTVDTEEEGREGAPGPWGWKARLPHTPSLGAPPLKPPPPTAGVRPGGGLPVLRPGWPPAREDRVGLPAPHPRPSAFPLRGPRRTHLLRAKVALSCGGRGEASLPRARRRLGAPGRRLSTRRTPSPAGSRLLRGCGGRGAAAGCGAGGATGNSEPSAPTRATFPAPPRSPPTPRAGPPPLATGWTRFRAERRGPAARCSAPPPAAAADASAAAPPGLPPALGVPGDLATQPCWRGAPRRGKRTARC